MTRFFSSSKCEQTSPIKCLTHHFQHIHFFNLHRIHIHSSTWHQWPFPVETLAAIRGSLKSSWVSSSSPPFWRSSALQCDHRSRCTTSPSKCRPSRRCSARCNTGRSGWPPGRRQTTSLHRSTGHSCRRSSGRGLGRRCWRTCRRDCSACCSSERCPRRRSIPALSAGTYNIKNFGSLGPRK